MLWELSVTEQRYRAVLEVLAGVPMTEVAGRYGVRSSADCELRQAHPWWGPKRLVFEMSRRGHGTVTRSTVCRVLVRNRLGEPRSRRRRRKDYKRWERPVPMQF